MNKRLSKDEIGFGHIGLILVVVVLGVVGFAGVRVYQNKQDKTVGNSSQKTSAKKYDDQRVDSKVLSNLKGTEESE